MSRMISNSLVEMIVKSAIQAQTKMKSSMMKLPGRFNQMITEEITVKIRISRISNKSIADKAKGDA